ncbi:thiol-disulfide oxidoreductase DCC family protein [Zavarzinella formosa]|uniref:thiol-disulfide oxidoreductase DCC family protein n=1 Tax=Zavarzinella formosa TaxID=360055 RepID=UPI000317F424|nr:DUF393 domain-containing protein [Zavarzinella formosa]
MARLQIFYDGRCHLCSREISHYRKKAIPGTTEFVDITADTFDPVAEGFDPKRVNRHLHTRLDGKLFIGVDAFRAIWSVIPGYRWLGWLTGLPVVHFVSKFLYSIFARIRPLFPKRRKCGTEACQIGGKAG